MKREVFGFLALMILAACGNSKPPVATDDNSESTDTIKVEEPQEQTPKYDNTDAKSFGLNGMVKSVETQIYSTHEEGSELKEGSVLFNGTVEFDNFGHIIHDEWGNEYGYDADGNYYRGNHLYTTIQRDKDGRLTKYNDEEPKKDNESNKTFRFKYDKNGRLLSVEVRGWTEQWTEKRQYKGNGINPESATLSGTYEGGGEFLHTIKYTYQHSDKYGNWTERIEIKSSSVTEITDEEEDSPQISEEIRIERRTITYYE